MALNPIQRQLHDIINRGNPLTLLEVAPGVGKTYYVGRRAIHGCSQGRSMLIVTSDRKLRADYTEMTASTEKNAEILRDILDQPEVFPGANLNDLEQVRFQPIYGKSEIIRGKKAVLGWLHEQSWVRELFPVIADDLERSARFYDGETIPGSPVFRSDLDQEADFQNELVARSALDSFQKLFFSTGTMPVQFAQYVRLPTSQSYVIPVITYHKFIYDTTMITEKPDQPDDLSGTIYVRDEIFLDEAHEIVRIGETFTNYAFDLTRFVETLKRFRCDLTENWYQAGIQLHRSTKDLIKATNSPYGVPLAYDEPFNQPDSRVIADKKYKVHEAFEAFCAYQEDLAMPPRTDSSLLDSDVSEYTRLEGIRMAKKKIIREIEKTGSMNAHFWSLFDVETANTLIWFARFNRVARITDQDHIELVLTSRNPGAAFRALTRPYRTEPMELPRVILLSGTLFQARKGIPLQTTKKNLLNLIGIGESFVNHCHILPASKTEFNQQLPWLYRTNPLLHMDKTRNEIFSTDEIDYQGSITHTLDSAIQVWTKAIIDFQREQFVHRRMAVLLASWADGYRIRDCLVRSGVNSSNIILSNQNDFITATMNNPDAILLTTKTNGYNIVDPDGFSLIRNYLLTRVPNGRDSELTVKRFLSWTRTLQFLGRGMRGNPSPDLNLIVGDSRFTDAYFPRNWFQ